MSVFSNVYCLTIESDMYIIQHRFFLLDVSLGCVYPFRLPMCLCGSDLKPWSSCCNPPAWRRGENFVLCFDKLAFRSLRTTPNRHKTSCIRGLSDGASECPTGRTTQRTVKERLRYDSVGILRRVIKKKNSQFFGWEPKRGKREGVTSERKKSRAQVEERETWDKKGDDRGVHKQIEEERVSEEEQGLIVVLCFQGSSVLDFC